jgi:hypothetical protein
MEIRTGPGAAVLWVICLSGLWAPSGSNVAAQSPKREPNNGSAHVDCGKEQSGALQRAIDRAQAGQTIVVTGTCYENVAIPPGKDLITLDGGGSGAIHGPDSTVNTLQIRGPRGVTVKGLTISGGRVAIDVSRGASAVIDGNTIEGTARNGITLGAFASANIINNTIQNNASAGILVTGNAFGFIGFATADDTVASPNVIRNNGTNGISVTLSSSARIAGNAISNNTRHGINVERASQATVSDNDIDANGQHGVFVTDNSVVNLGIDNGTGLFDGPNRTTANNALRGIACRVGGSANGQRGTLNGNGGAKDFGTSCVDSLDVPDTF